MQDRRAGEKIDPKAAGIKLTVRPSVTLALVGHDRFRSELAGPQSVVNPFSGKRFNNTRRVPHQIQPGLARGQRRAGQRCDRPPWMIGRD